MGLAPSCPWYGCRRKRSVLVMFDASLNRCYNKLLGLLQKRKEGGGGDESKVSAGLSGSSGFGKWNGCFLKYVDAFR